MTSTNPGARNRVKRHLLRALGAIMAPAAAIVVMAVPASAAPLQACSGLTTSNSCLTIELRDDGNYDVSLGIDFYMSQQDAQAVIDAPGSPFTAKVVGVDSHSDLPQNLFSVPLVRLGASAQFGLSADFTTVVSPALLNEDDEEGNRVDDVQGVIRLVDARFGSRTFNTPEIHAIF